jgi:hypothetical protein
VGDHVLLIDVEPARVPVLNTTSITHILAYLDTPVDRCALARVSKNWHAATLAPQLYATIDFSNVRPPSLLPLLNRTLNENSRTRTNLWTHTHTHS